MTEVLVPDTSVIIQGVLSEMIKTGKIKKARIVIPKAVVDELQAQASRHRDTGFEGLEEIKRIREAAKGRDIKIEFAGERPTLEEIQLAKKGRIDAIIRDVAVKMNGRLITSDYVQALVGEAEGVDVEYIEQPALEKIDLEDFFDRETQSVHLKVGVRPFAKRGKPGNVRLVELRKSPVEEKEIKGLINQIFSKTRTDENSFIEIGKQGATVIQMGNYRISITYPPFSDGLELTAVRPLAKLSLDDYKLHNELQERLLKGSRGILIAGPPGSGKSTFAASIADFLVSKNKIVKTFEQPRDLQVGPEVTQYAPLDGNWENTAELLLLVRPDYTIFDEIRRTKDFKIFGDMRLAGVGMIGVVHSTNPVSAIQRFIGRIELGMIPHVIDTVIYISEGKIEKIYEMTLTVKVPTGMKDEDLARPVVEVRNFETGELEYEIYPFGEENVIVPIKEHIVHPVSPLKELAKKKIYEEIGKWDPQAEIEILSDDRIIVKVRNEFIARIIGKGGKNIESLEKKLGIRISIEPKEGTTKKEIYWDFEETGTTLNILVDSKLSGKKVDMYSGKDFLLTAYVGKGGRIRIKKKSSLGKAVLQAVSSNRLKVFL